MEVPQSSEVKEQVQPVQQSCLFLVISILKEYFPFSHVEGWDGCIGSSCYQVGPYPQGPQGSTEKCHGKKASESREAAREAF